MSEDRQDRDVAFIRALAELLRENDLTELQVKREDAEEGSLNVRVSRQALVAPPAPPPATGAAAPATAASPSDAAVPEAEVEDPALLPGAVTSPMVGTVYLAPEPGAATFVSVGDQVAEGQTLLIVEAMKTMNQIPAPRAGRVGRILVENGAPVEFGAPLMVID
ncbi:MAG: acetyl-CoA carboxylase biotin carboxyl carrier protein [Paracoccaceae bacterium]|jgi:acetyl-CoA carboxylase biotin carboxyl carrier protein|nr:acetyl-CoA carboxylase biotin carboxyl carrier protein [Paracoccaceae bacterium]